MQRWLLSNTVAGFLTRARNSLKLKKRSTSSTIWTTETSHNKEKLGIHGTCSCSFCLSCFLSLTWSNKIYRNINQWSIKQARRPIYHYLSYFTVYTTVFKYIMCSYIENVFEAILLWSCCTDAKHLMKFCNCNWWKLLHMATEATHRKFNFAVI